MIKNKEGREQGGTEGNTRKNKGSRREGRQRKRF
jgi:hypothetical protein